MESWPSRVHRICTHHLLFPAGFSLIIEKFEIVKHLEFVLGSLAQSGSKWILCCDVVAVVRRASSTFVEILHCCRALQKHIHPRCSVYVTRCSAIRRGEAFVAERVDVTIYLVRKISPRVVLTIGLPSSSCKRLVFYFLS